MSSRILDLEEELKEKGAEQDILLSLFDKGTAVLFKWNNDEEWGVSYVSESVERLFGYKSSDFVNNTVCYIDLIHKDDLQRVYKEVDVAIQKDRDYFEHEPYRIHTKNGATKWVQDSTSTVKNAEGEIIYFLGTVVDVTAIKEKDKQLLQQYKLAQMGEMISMIAHQWRQPLNTISITASNLNLNIMLNKYDLSHKEEAKKFKEYLCENLNNVEAYTQTLSKTIDDFRNFYKSDKKLMLLNTSEPVEKALSIIKVSLINNGVKIRQVYKSTKKVNLFDSEMMHVILNILKNAEDNFRDKKIQNPTIDILSYDTLYGVVLEISDNGGGIPKSIINRIFEPYFSSKDNKVGTGLGLYMSKIIVEEHHGGTLHVSNNKEGACFSIELPA
ncbi:MAG: PAS domain-containing sensor histidine kinase [Sulfurimonas sp.]|jgi:PAS domain S-box-containing protein